MRNTNSRMAILVTALTLLVMAAGDASAQLNFPYHGMGASATDALFWMTQNGTANAGRFEIASSTNSKGALVGITQGTGYGLYGLTYRGYEGIHGESRVPNGIGVKGIGGNGESARGVYGQAPSGVGVYGISSTNAGVYGTSSNGDAGYFRIANTISAGAAVRAFTTGTGQGVYATVTGNANAGYFESSGASSTDPCLSAASNGAPAVLGSNSGTANHAAVFYVTNAANGYAALYAQTYGTGKAGHFVGDVQVSGTLIKTGGSFKIDHPLDPANKYLSHSFVESPDMMNVYNGNVVLDRNGEAWIELPEWFEALNRDFRYQLTCIGGFAPVYVASKIADNRFKIGGGTPDLEVSWQVTGIRQDAWANEHRIPVEEDKPAAEQGLYLHPEVFGLPRSMGVESVHQ